MISADFSYYDISNKTVRWYSSSTYSFLLLYNFVGESFVSVLIPSLIFNVYNFTFIPFPSYKNLDFCFAISISFKYGLFVKTISNESSFYLPWTKVGESSGLQFINYGFILGFALSIL